VREASNSLRQNRYPDKVIRVLGIHERLTTYPPKNGRFYTVAIDGRGGSGKTRLAALLSVRLPGFLIINGDDYFEPLQGESAWGEFNEHRFEVDVLDPIQRGSNHIVYQPYDFEHGALRARQEEVINQGICIERCFSLGFPIDWDLKIWVETPKEVCLSRGIARELMPRDRVIAVWEQVWQPREDQYIETIRPTELADQVIDGTRPFEDQIL
jgi:uridine kinase